MTNFSVPEIRITFEWINWISFNEFSVVLYQSESIDVCTVVRSVKSNCPLKALKARERPFFWNHGIENDPNDPVALIQMIKMIRMIIIEMIKITEIIEIFETIKNDRNDRNNRNDQNDQNDRNDQNDKNERNGSNLIVE